MKKKRSPLISIIVTTFNRKHIVSKTIDSILSQNYHNKEIIVIDDCSNDGTEEFLKKKYKNLIFYLKHNVNKGVQNASNTGFSYSKGEFLAFVGDDDIWTDKNKLNEQIKIFNIDKNNKIGIVTTSVRIINNNSTKIKTIVKPKNLLVHLLSGNDSIYGSAALLRRTAFIDADKFDPNLNKGTDSDVYRRIVIKGYDVHYIKKYMVDYSEVEINRMSNFTKENIMKNINAHFYKLNKYHNLYDKMPKAKSLLLMYIGDNYYILSKKFSRPKDLFLSEKYYFKSLYSYYFNFRAIYKIILVIILKFKKLI